MNRQLNIQVTRLAAAPDANVHFPLPQDCCNKDVVFERNPEHMNAIVIWMEALHIAQWVQPSDDIHMEGQIDLGVETSIEQWESIFPQEDEIKDQQPWFNNSRLCNNTKKMWHLRGPWTEEGKM
jgi:hypothetical protein